MTTTSKYGCEPYLLDVLVALKTIVTEGPDEYPTWEFDSDYGICRFVDLHMDRLANEFDDIDYGLITDHTSAMRQMFLRWPDFSGNHVFPVPIQRIDAGSNWEDVVREAEDEGFEEGDPSFECSVAEEAFYNDGISMWEGGYGQLRIELLDFCIDYLEDNGYEF